ncbi:bacterial regulatory s, tetR family protein [Mycobacterium xenopi 3993]|nr:bacterial regulatory s, tetR family protein [Mycobacterium xenopi 3993]
MSTEAAGHGRLPELTGDARADRWREHRAAVRAELVEATLRAIEEYGPDLSIDDVVKTAGVTRPKLYRFFTDKDTLFSAVGERVQAMVLERVVPRFSIAGTALDMVRSAVAAYVDLVDERPTSFAFWSAPSSPNAAQPRPCSRAAGHLPTPRATSWRALFKPEAETARTSNTSSTLFSARWRSVCCAG